MADSSMASVLDRLDRLERENDRLRYVNLWWKRLGLLAAVALAALTLGFPDRPAATQAQERGGAPAPHPPTPETIRLGLGTKVVESEQYLLRDESGTLLATLATNQDGTPTVGLHGKDQAARLFLRVDPDGEPGIIFFDKDGRRPVELVVSRDGAPVLKVIEKDGQPLFGPPRERP